MYDMFSSCSSLTTIYAGSEWSTVAVTDGASMFYGCTNLVGGKGTVYDDVHVDAEYARIDGGPTSETPGYFTDRDAPVVTEPEAYAVLDGTTLTFYYDDQKAERGGVDINNTFVDSSPYGTATTAVIDASFADYRPTSTAYWFTRCPSLTSITGMENLKTDNVTTMNYMFSGCRSLTSLDVSGFNTSNVTHMAGMFNGCISLPVLDISSFNTAKVTDMGDIFVDCRSLASIVAGSADVPDEEYAKVENPNLLVYVDDASLAPAGIQNVVIGDVAKEIVLVDVTSGNNNFYVPKAFTTEKISYSHNFTQQTTPGVSRGWESLVLPFTVQTITHETHGELKPYKAAEGDKPFWLRTLTASGIKSAVRIVANMPYLISMPNNTDAYDEEYCQGGVVTFASASVTVPATKLTVAALSDSSIVMRPTLLRVPQSETVYALNIGEPRGTYAEGSVFERDYRDVRPFECYTMHKSGTGGSRFITLGDLNGGDATGIQDIDYADWAGDGAVYDLGGRRVDSSMVNGQWSKIKGQRSKLSKGVYIQNGRKRVVK
jgi:surface protein